MIGYVPIITYDSARQDGRYLLVTFEVLGKFFTLKYYIPAGFCLRHDGGRDILVNEDGREAWPDDIEMQARLSAVTIDRF
jgi:hypothetical protein